MDRAQGQCLKWVDPLRKRGRGKLKARLDGVGRGEPNSDTIAEYFWVPPRNASAGDMVKGDFL